MGDELFGSADPNQVRGKADVREIQLGRFCQSLEVVAKPCA